MNNTVIIGATSAIAQATARLFAQRNERILLVGRSDEKLEHVKQELLTLGADTVLTAVCDFSELISGLSSDQTETNRYRARIDEWTTQLGPIDKVLVAHGTLPDQQTVAASANATMEALQVNALSTIGLLTELANDMESRGSGVIAVIGSVAGDRGRQSNYVYGTAKASLSVFCAGLRNRLMRTTQGRVHVMTIKPGFVDSPMTASFKKGFLWAQPEAIALAIQQGIDKRRNTIYTPWFWRFIMLIICNIPERIFKRLPL